MTERPPIHTIVYGDPGAGKSTFASTFPKPMRVWMFDAVGKDTPYRLQPDVVIEYFNDLDPTGAKGGWHHFIRRRDEYLATREWEQDATLVVDSITFMELAARKYDQYVTNKTSKDPRKWFAASTDAIEETLMMKLMGVPRNVVSIAHVDQERDDVHGLMLMNPSAPGRLKKRIPAAYSEFYRAFVARDEQGQPMYLLQTTADNRYNASSQIKAPNPSWQHYASLWPQEGEQAA